VGGLVAAGLALVLAASLTSAGSAAPAGTGGSSAGVASAEPRRVDRPLLPNMTPLRASDISITGTGDRRRIRFQTALANIGRGPMELRPNRRVPCPRNQRGASQILYRDVDGSRFFSRKIDTTFTRRAAGCMVFHPTHNHWHIEASSFYSLRPASAGEGRASAYRKTSFCLRDSERVPEHLGTYKQPLFYGVCSRDEPMGVNIGWADVYQSFLDGQSLHLGRRRSVPNGRYCLTIRVDPRDALIESDETDNDATRSIRIRGTSVSMLAHRVCR
jgi:hypothetical protein